MAIHVPQKRARIEEVRSVAKATLISCYQSVIDSNDVDSELLRLRDELQEQAIILDNID